MQGLMQTLYHLSHVLDYFSYRVSHFAWPAFNHDGQPWWWSSYIPLAAGDRPEPLHSRHLLKHNFAIHLVFKLITIGFEIAAFHNPWNQPCKQNFNPLVLKHICNWGLCWAIVLKIISKARLLPRMTKKLENNNDTQKDTKSLLLPISPWYGHSLKYAREQYTRLSQH
jgi:hypothetical protein